MCSSSFVVLSGGLRVLEGRGDEAGWRRRRQSTLSAAAAELNTQGNAGRSLVVVRGVSTTSERGVGDACGGVEVGAVVVVLVWVGLGVRGIVG